MIRDFPCKPIRKNHTAKRPSRMLIFDTETDHIDTGLTQHHTMKIAWSNYLERDSNGKITNDAWKLFDNNVKLWEYVTSKCYDKSTLYIFAHNAFFDLQCSGFFHIMTQENWHLQFIYNKGLSFILSVKKGNKSIKVISTTNFFDFSLKKIGEMVGIKKLDVDFEHDSDEYVKEYCRNDVMITRVALLQYLDFIDDHDMGNFGMTKASQSFNCYRHRFMPCQILVHKEEDIIAHERASYVGGRNECFELGELKGGPFYHYDINSMYPSVMREEMYPTKLIDVVENISIDELYNYCKRFCAIAEVDIETDVPIYPKIRDGKVLFPIGKLHVTIPTGSINYAIKHNHIKKIYKVSFYEKDYIFRDYIDYFYALKRKYKEEGNEIYTKLVKIFLNSLYGKFGQKNEIEKIEINDDNYGYYRIENLDIDTGERWTETEILHATITGEGEENAPTSLVAIPSHVTDYARLKLWEIIEQVGVDKVLYCDTDSVKVREKDKDRITFPMDKYELGKLSLEDITEKFIIHGCKDYETEKDCKIKGVPKSAEKLPDGSYKYSYFPKMNTHLRKKIDDHYLIISMIKKNKRIYTKGVVMKNNRIRPFTLHEW